MLLFIRGLHSSAILVIKVIHNSSTGMFLVMRLINQTAVTKLCLELEMTKYADDIGLPYWMDHIEIYCTQLVPLMISVILVNVRTQYT